MENKNFAVLILQMTFEEKYQPYSSGVCVTVLLVQA